MTCCDRAVCSVWHGAGGDTCVSGQWSVVSGYWSVVSASVVSDRWSVVSGQWSVPQWSVPQWSVIGGQWSVVSGHWGQWSVVRDRWSVVSGQWPCIACDMEQAATLSSRCRLRQATSDNFDWTRIAGRTVSGRLSDRRIDTYRYPVTGPESALQGNYYIYIEASGQYRDSVARLSIIVHSC